MPDSKEPIDTPESLICRSDSELVSELYGELRRLAADRMRRERTEHTLTPTALVHEAWLRMVGDRPEGWNGRAQFFAAAAEAMRRILIESARKRARSRHGGGRRFESLDGIVVQDLRDPIDVLALDDALAKIEVAHPRVAQVAKLRLYAGLSQAEIGDQLGLDERTIRRAWRYARACLAADLGYGLD